MVLFLFYFVMPMFCLLPFPDSKVPAPLALPARAHERGGPFACPRLPVPVCSSRNHDCTWHTAHSSTSTRPLAFVLALGGLLHLRVPCPSAQCAGRGFAHELSWCFSTPSMSRTRSSPTFQRLPPGHCSLQASGDQRTFCSARASPPTALLVSSRPSPSSFALRFADCWPFSICKVTYFVPISVHGDLPVSPVVLNTFCAARARGR